jgi:hypothetical protein
LQIKDLNEKLQKLQIQAKDSLKKP